VNVFNRFGLRKAPRLAGWSSKGPRSRFDELAEDGRFLQDTAMGANSIAAMNLSYVIIYVPDVPEALSFYERAFALRQRFLHETEQFGELDTGGIVLAFTGHALAAQAVPVKYRPLRSEDEPVGFELTLTTDDVSTAYARALHAGAQPVAEPHNTPWGQTVAYVRDHVGTVVGLATPMS
jgi:uncharacterized glyoxalase superfamily protein PhnB